MALTPKKPRSILQYVKDHRLAACVVCRKLTPELLAQIKDATKRQRIPIETVLEWLAKEHGIRFTLDQWTTHRVGRHDVGR